MAWEEVECKSGKDDGGSIGVSEGEGEGEGEVDCLQIFLFLFCLVWCVGLVKHGC